MKIDIKSTNLDLTSPIKEYVEEKIGSLDRFIPKHDGNPRTQRAEQSSYDGDSELRHETVEAFVEIARTTKHHRQGDVFRAEVNLKIGGKILRAQKQDWDIRVAIDGVKEELKMELQKEKGISESKFKRGARILKRLRSISPLAWFRKEK
ncbi:HPF/RaiA family ribosome-associated protein [Candidatus Azambacteria bacterium]|nr:HPF/RaiA family ribosome-associated protein [Candidatus Azambacteria bacterium]